MAKVRLQIGRQRFGKGLKPWEASYGRSVAAQMKQIVDNYKKVIDGIEDASVPGLTHAIRPIYTTSQVLVPKDTRKLMRSGFIQVDKNSRGVSAVVGYARGGVPHYAILVHERMDFRHEEPTQAKFLEEAANRHIDKIVERYADYVRSTLGL